MKKPFLLLASFAAWAACTDPQPADSATRSEVPSDTAAAVPAPATAILAPATAAENPRPYFTGSGNEPGWRLQLQAASDGSFPAHLLMDYGLDTLTGSFPASHSDADQEKLAGSLKKRGANVPVEVLITRKECADDMSGVKSGAMLEIKVDGKSYRGCGNFAK